MKIIRLGYTTTYSNNQIEQLFLGSEQYLSSYITNYKGNVCHYFPTGKIKNIIGENELLFSDIEFLNDLQEESKATPHKKW